MLNIFNKQLYWFTVQIQKQNNHKLIVNNLNLNLKNKRYLKLKLKQKSFFFNLYFSLFAKKNHAVGYAEKCNYQGWF